MGIIKRQGIKQSSVALFATFISALATLFVYPMEKEAYGLAQFIINAGMLIAPFMLLGTGSIAVRFFPYFQDENNKNNGFLGWLLAIVLTAGIVVLLLFLNFEDVIALIYQNRPDISTSYLKFIPFLAILMAVLSLMISYTSNFGRIAIPAIFNVFIKFSLPLLVLAVAFQRITEQDMLGGILVTFLLAVIGIFIYLRVLGHLDIRFKIPKLGPNNDIRSMSTYAAYAILANVGSLLAIRIDQIMVPTILDTSQNGTYSIAFFIASTIAIPTTAITAISGPIIASRLKNNDIQHVEMIYRKSSINLILLGSILFACIMAGLNDLFKIMPKGDELVGAFSVVFFVGAAKIIDMMTSVNANIVGYSKYYRFHLYSLLLLSAVNIGLNIWLIPLYNIKGAAIATFLSITFFNVIMMIYIWAKFRIQPLSWSTLFVLLLAAAAYCLTWLIPDMNSAVINILLKTAVACLFYFPIVIATKISPDANDLFFNLLKQLGLRK